MGTQLGEMESGKAGFVDLPRAANFLEPTLAFKVS